MFVNKNVDPPPANDVKFYPTQITVLYLWKVNTVQWAVQYMSALSKENIRIIGTVRAHSDTIWVKKTNIIDRTITVYNLFPHSGHYKFLTKLL